MVLAGNVAQGSRDWPGRGKTMRSPDTPSEEERARHNLTHAPAKPWGAECVAARGRGRLPSGGDIQTRCLITVFELDQGESGRAADLHNNVSMLVAGVTSTGVVHAVGAQIKGFRRQERRGTHEDFYLRSGGHVGHSLLRRRTGDSGKLSGSESFDCGRCAGRKSSRSSHGYALRRRADRGGCSSPRGMEWRASEPPSALMAKAQPASFLAGYALEMWWSGSWLGQGSKITELLVRTLDNAQSCYQEGAEGELVELAQPLSKIQRFWRYCQVSVRCQKKLWRNLR